jgi:hypothetical protein
MPETPLGYRYPQGTDTPDVPRDMEALAEDSDEKTLLLLMGAI